MDDIVPSAVPLKTRVISFDQTCMVCGAFEDSSCHILITCHLAVDVWVVIFPSILPLTLNLSTENIWEEMFLFAEREDCFAMFGVALWTLLNNRDTVCFDLKSLSSFSIIAMIHALVAENFLWNRCNINVLCLLWFIGYLQI